MRNAVGAIGQQKFVRSLLSMLRVLDIPYQWIDARNKNSWIDMTDDDLIVEENIKAISWNYNGSTRVLGFNITIPIVKKNVDLCLFNVDTNTYIETKVQNTPESIILLGELKGGIDQQVQMNTGKLQIQHYEELEMRSPKKIYQLKLFL